MTNSVVGTLKFTKHPAVRHTAAVQTRTSCSSGRSGGPKPWSDFMLRSGAIWCVPPPVELPSKSSFVTLSWAWVTAWLAAFAAIDTGLFAPCFGSRTCAQPAMELAAATGEQHIELASIPSPCLCSAGYALQFPGKRRWLIAYGVAPSGKVLGIDHRASLPMLAPQFAFVVFHENGPI